MENKTPKGFFVAVHRSLTQTMLMGGAPRDFVLMNATIGMAFVMLRVYPLLLINFAVHAIAVAFTKRDPQFFDALKRHMNDKDFYDV